MENEKVKSTESNVDSNQEEAVKTEKEIKPTEKDSNVAAEKKIDKKG